MATTWKPNTLIEGGFILSRLPVTHSMADDLEPYNENHGKGSSIQGQLSVTRSMTVVLGTAQPIKDFVLSRCQ